MNVRRMSALVGVAVPAVATATKKTPHSAIGPDGENINKNERILSRAPGAYGADTQYPKVC